LDKAPDAFRTISEVAEDLDVPQHVLRFWETRFTQIKPMKRGGGRRYYRPDDVDLLRGIRHLLYGEGYTIRGVQRILREQGVKFVHGVWQAGAEQPALRPADDEPAADQAADAPPSDDEIAERGRRLFGLLPSLLSTPEEETPGSPAEERREPTLGSATLAAPAGGPAARPERAVGASANRANLRARSDAAAAENIESPAGARLAREDARRLHAVLHELGECRRLLETALSEEA
jgi:DNA-binding transcriptional MerR regulator